MTIYGEQIWNDDFFNVYGAFVLVRRRYLPFEYAFFLPTFEYFLVSLFVCVCVCLITSAILRLKFHLKH